MFGPDDFLPLVVPQKGVPTVVGYYLTELGSTLWNDYESQRAMFMNDAVATLSPRYHPATIEIRTAANRVVAKLQTVRVHP